MKPRVILTDLVLTAPNPFFRATSFLRENKAKLHAQEISRIGYTSMGQFLNPEQVRELRDLMDQAIDGKIEGVICEWNEDVKYHVILRPFKMHSSLLRLALDPRVLNIASEYFGRPAYLADVDMRRIQPADAKAVRANSSSGWHRDFRGRQIKIMIYLTDVDERDSNFAVLPDSHRGKHIRWRMEESRISDQYVEKLSQKPLDWIGKAGEAMMFDTNTIHRLRRKITAKVRDTITFYYTPGQSLRHLEFIRDEDLENSINHPACQAPFFAKRH